MCSIAKFRIVQASSHEMFRKENFCLHAPITFFAGRDSAVLAHRNLRIMHGSRPRLSRRDQDTRRALGVPAAAVTRGWREADDLETEGEGQGCRQTSVKAAHRPLVKSDGSIRHTGSSAQMIGKSNLCLPRAV